ncbi:hypothetical protein [Streptomyces antibioticus]|uniref:hypothetical protein n=1 Tax=Streptomyces antibioticus TaxID=1890 RepID=UPI003F48655A
MSAGRNRGSDRFTTSGRDLTNAERAAATRAIGRLAADAEDETLLLSILGLGTAAPQSAGQRGAA